MKLIKKNTDLNKAIVKENNLGFVPTMGSLHKGHEFLIKKSKKICKKTIVSIFVNPKQFNNKFDFKTYPRNLKEDLKILKKLKVDFVYLPSIDQIFKKKRLSKITLKKSQKIMCAKFRVGHFEGVLDVLDRLVKLISPKIMFMGKKDYQQFFLVKDYIMKKYSTVVYPCKTIRNRNNVALSSRNNLLKKKELKVAGLIANSLIKLKATLNLDKKFTNINLKKKAQLIQKHKKMLTRKFNIKIEYLECRNLNNLSNNLNIRPFKLFTSYYLNNVRLIDNF
jgi:pantoate--beta-alanine ligase